MKYIEYGYHYAYSETGSKERPPPNRMKVREKKTNRHCRVKAPPDKQGYLRGGYNNKNHDCIFYYNI